MKKIILGSLLLVQFVTSAQDKMLTKTGMIAFESLDNVFKDVKALNKGVTCVLNTKTGEIASLALAKEFHFKIALMEEHFNESYVESDKFPKAVFRGNLENFDFKTLSSTEKEYNLKGKLELHGRTQDIVTTAKVFKNGSSVEIHAEFKVPSTDYGILIPTMAKNKVTNNINIICDFVVKPVAGK